MSYEEVEGNSGGGGFEDREFVSAKIGTEFEGTFRSMSKRLPSKFGGEYRIVSLDLTDDRKVSIPAGKILLERVEAAGLADGDRVKIEVGSATSKTGREYALPRLYVDRQTPASISEPKVATPPRKAAVPQDPPF